MSLILWNTFFYIVIPEIVQLFTLWTVFKELFGFFNGVTCNPFNLSSPDLFPTQILTGSTEFFGKSSRLCQLCWGAKASLLGLPCSSPSFIPFGWQQKLQKPALSQNQWRDFTRMSGRVGWLPWYTHPRKMSLSLYGGWFWWGRDLY